MGGTEPAREYVAAAMRAGKPVVTANKQLLAQHGDELFAVAREAGVQLRFEAAVAAVIPIVRTIQESFGVTEIDKVYGIVNGTTNFILSEMAATGADYGDVLARAQELGYAEADPTDDVSGADAAAKMAILARLAFHTPVTLSEVTYEGIEAISPHDLAFAQELGLSLKLLGMAERRGEGISVRVFPCFLYRGHPLAPIEGAFNAVMVEGPAMDEVTLSGPGAGGLQTASAVLGDVVSILAGDAPVHETRTELPIVADVTSSFYLHLEVADQPGVLARIATVLGDHDVSVKSVVQRGFDDDARLVMVLHECLESRFAASGRGAQRARRAAGAGALDPRDRGGAVQCPNRADRALPRAALAAARRPRRQPAGGLDPADPRRPALASGSAPASTSSSRAPTRPGRSRTGG